MRLRKGPPDFILFITTLLLVGIGLIMVFSSSAVTSNIRYDDAYLFFRKQLLWALIGIICMLVVMKFNYVRIKDLAIPLMLFTLLCLILVMTPLGIDTKGASRWLGVGTLQFTPSELAKLAMAMFLAKVMEVNLDRMKSFTQGILPILVLIALVCGLIMLQPDLGTSFAIAGTAFFMMMAAGARGSHLGLIALSGAGVVAAAIAVAPIAWNVSLHF